VADHLTQAIKKTGEAYNNIGKMFEDQPKADWEPLADRMHIYKGMLASYPDILNVHKVSALNYRISRNNTALFFFFITIHFKLGTTMRVIFI
jgi:hypothetical protein